MEAKAKFLERRLYPRSEVAAIATVYLNDRWHGPFPVKDLSASGVRLRIGIPLDLIDPLEVTLRFSDGQSVTTSARLVHTCTAPRGTADAPRDQREEASFSFLHESPDLEDTIHQAILGQLEQSHIDRAVLVADGSLETCVTLRQELEDAGRTVIFAHTPLDTICWLENPRVEIDTVMVNLNLGGSAGSGILDYLIEEHPRVRRVLMSDGTHGWQGDLATKTGRAHACLSMPWTRRKLCELFE